MPVEVTPMKNRPSKCGSRARRARSQTRASSCGVSNSMALTIAPTRPDASRFRTWVPRAKKWGGPRRPPRTSDVIPLTTSAAVRRLAVDDVEIHLRGCRCQGKRKGIRGAVGIATVASRAGHLHRDVRGGARKAEIGEAHQITAVLLIAQEHRQHHVLGEIHLRLVRRARQIGERLLPELVEIRLIVYVLVLLVLDVAVIAHVQGHDAVATAAAHAGTAGEQERQ